MSAIVAEQLLWSNEEDFETESRLSQSLSFNILNLYHRHIHASRFRTVQQQNLRYWFKGYADIGNKDRLTPMVITEELAMVLKWSLHNH